MLFINRSEFLQQNLLQPKEISPKTLMQSYKDEQNKNNCLQTVAKKQ